MIDEPAAPAAPAAPAESNDSVDSVNPRIERSRTAILEATLDELAESGYGAMTIESVARRAGASKATVYRHWTGKLDLVADAVARLKQMPRPPETDDHYERIVGYLEAIADHVANGRFAACVPAIVEASLTDPSVREFHVRTSAERLAFGARLLDEARDAGHLGAEIDTRAMSERLVAPIFFRRLMADRPFPPDEARALVDGVLAPHWRAPVARA
jgi:TetR/AcrR family transcriptional regulator of autoinduction and epiphytic fitness